MSNEKTPAEKMAAARAKGKAIAVILKRPAEKALERGRKERGGITAAVSHALEQTYPGRTK